MADYNHIEIIKEEYVSKYRFPKYGNPPKIPTRNRIVHGEELKSELSAASNVISLARQQSGLDPNNLIIISIIGEAISPDIIDNMVRKFNLSLVEEKLDKDTGYSNLLVQFPDSEAIQKFEIERSLFQTDSQEIGTLTYVQRTTLFNCISSIRTITREDRMGPKLLACFKESKPYPQGEFIVDIDVWYDGDRSQINSTERLIRHALGTLGSSMVGDLLEIPSLLLGRVRVNEFSLNALLDLDLIAKVDYPIGFVADEPSELYSFDYQPIIEDNLDENAPVAAVLDSGVFSANPLLNSVIIAEENFDKTEQTTSDLNGHGTGVAGIVVYGDFYGTNPERIFKPLVRICNGKIMHNVPETGNAAFSDDRRPEHIIKDAIIYFHREFNCRVFNISAGDASSIFMGGRQFAWAELLDQLARGLDIVIIVSAGNVSNPVIDEFSSRAELMEKCRDQLFSENHRLIDPATSALSLTVGSVSRHEEPETIANRGTRFSIGKSCYPSAFTRIGKGINRAIKPEFVHFGGNYAIHQSPRGESRWMKKDRMLMELSLSNDTARIFRGFCGTSFSAPHVTHIAARVERSIQNQLNAAPSANLVRAMVANTARCTSDMVSWTEDSKDPFYNGKSNPKQERRLRLIGYGIPHTEILLSNDKNVTLFAEDSLELRSYHLYKIPVPKNFARGKASKRISISLAYDPITRLSRKEYLSNNLWFEVFRKIDLDTLARFKSKKETDEETDDLPNFPDCYKAAFSPGYTEIYKSTLQQRVWEKSKHGGDDLLWDIDEPYIYVLITGKEKFKYPDQNQPQNYALVITYSYEGNDDIQLYNTIKNQVRVRTRHIVRTRTQIRI